MGVKPAKVAASHRIGRHRKRARQRSVHLSPFIADEEKLRSFDRRSAEGAAELILSKRRHRLILDVEVVVRVERVAAMELERAAAERIAAGPGRDVDECRRLPAELRRIHRFLNLELADRVERRIDYEVVEQLVGDLGTVEQIDVVTGPLAADVRQRTGLLQRVAARSARRNDDRIAQLQPATGSCGR